MLSYFYGEHSFNLEVKSQIAILSGVRFMTLARRFNY